MTQDTLERLALPPGLALKEEAKKDALPLLVKPDQYVANMSERGGPTIREAEGDQTRGQSAHGMNPSVDVTGTRHACAHVQNLAAIGHFFSPTRSLKAERPFSADVAGVLSCAATALRDGGVVAVPTDTIYGLACLAQNSAAVRHIYDIKGRDQQKPLAICVGEIHDIYK